MLFLFVRPFYLYPHSHIPCIMHILSVICCICAHWFVKCFGVVAPISCAGLLVHCFSLFFLLCPEFLWSDYAYCCSCFDLLTFVHSTGCLWQFLCYNLRWNAACLLHYLLANIPVTFLPWNFLFVAWLFFHCFLMPFPSSIQKKKMLCALFPIREHVRCRYFHLLCIVLLIIFFYIV